MHQQPTKQLPMGIRMIIIMGTHKSAHEMKISAEVCGNGKQAEKFTESNGVDIVSPFHSISNKTTIFPLI